jgi:hypothetical protein
LIDLSLDLFFVFFLILDLVLDLAPIAGINEEVRLIPLDDQQIDLFFSLFEHWVMKTALT